MSGAAPVGPYRREVRLHEVLLGALGAVPEGVPDTIVTGVAQHADKVRPGYLFVARVGAVVDGHAFAAEAVARGAVCVVGGSVLIVQNAAVLARAMGVPELVIALTLVAIGTSLPECVTAVNSLRRGHGEIAVGNVIGANVLNLTLVLGGSAAILPLTIEPQTFALHFPAMGALMLLTFLFGEIRGKIGRAGGALFASIYAAYLITLVIYFV